MAGACSLVTTTPVVISTGLTGCSTQSSNTGRKVAIDSGDTIYAAMVCSGTAQIAVSTNLGTSFAAPVPLGVANVSDLQIVAAAAGTVYAAVLDTADNAWFTYSTNHGASWITPLKLGTDADGWISAATYGTSVYVATGSEFTLYTNDALGVGAFTTTATTDGTAFGDVAVDPATGNVWALYDTGEGNVAVSTNGGVSFATPTVDSFGSFFSDWTIGGGYIFEASADPNPVVVIPLATPTVASAVAGVTASGDSEQQAISADAAGHAYFVTSDGTTGTLQQIFAATLTSGAAVSLGAATYPGVVAGPGGAVVIFTNGANVSVQVHAF